jgi:hypothetical protein
LQTTMIRKRKNNQDESEVPDVCSPRESLVNFSMTEAERNLAKLGRRKRLPPLLAAGEDGCLTPYHSPYERRLRHSTEPP